LNAVNQDFAGNASSVTMLLYIADIIMAENCVSWKHFTADVNSVVFYPVTVVKLTVCWYAKWCHQLL